LLFSHLIPTRRSNHHVFPSTARPQASTKVECTSYFVNSLAWIRDESGGSGGGDDGDSHLDAAAALSENEGKIVCPNLKCGNRVGSHNWSGAQCACGAWVVPAIQFLKKTVDLRHPVSAATTAALAGARPLAIVRPIGGGARAVATRPPQRLPVQSIAATDPAANGAATSASD
jgi:hypothetical protein